MVEHLTVISAMLRDLKAFGDNANDNQQILATIKASSDA